MRRRSGLALLVLAVLVLVVPAGTAVAQPSAPSVVVVGVAGLGWNDLGPSTPVLSRLVAEGAVGALSVKALPAVTCRGDGWLTLGAGSRAQQFGPTGADDPPVGADRGCDAGLVDVRDAAQLTRQSELNAATRDAAVLGALAQALAESSYDGQVQVEGAGAELALLQAGAAGGAPADGRPVVRLVDAGSITTSERAASLRTVDAAVGRALEGLPSGTDVLLVGLAEPTGGDRAHLQLAVARGPSFPLGGLTSGSTRRADYVQLIDVAPTVLSLVGVDVPATMTGRPWQVSGPAPSVAALVDLDRKAQGQRAATVPFYVVLLGLTLVAGLLAAWRRRWALVEVVALAGTAGLGASYLANLVPWWRVDSPLLGLLAVVVPLSVVVAVLARRAGADRSVTGPAGLVCGFVTVVLAVDLVTGAGLQMSSVAGYSPLVAGRFAGIGNVAFGVLAAAVLLATAAATATDPTGSTRRGTGRRALLIAAIGVVAVAVDGAAAWGSDVGGVLALVPAFLVLAMLRTGVRVSLLRLVAAGTAGAAVVAGFGLADWSRAPENRTHLGRFVQDLLDGKAGPVLARKASAVLELLFFSPLTALLPLVVAAAVYLVVRPPGPLAAAFQVAPAWRHGLLALGVASLLGFALNDSGASVPALALCVALPATAAVTARARRLSTGSQPL